MSCRPQATKHAFERDAYLATSAVYGGLASARDRAATAGSAAIPSAGAAQHPGPLPRDGDGLEATIAGAFLAAALDNNNA